MWTYFFDIWKVIADIFLCLIFYIRCRPTFWRVDKRHETMLCRFISFLTILSSTLSIAKNYHYFFPSLYELLHKMFSLLVSLKSKDSLIERGQTKGNPALSTFYLEEAQDQVSINLLRWFFNPFGEINLKAISYFLLVWGSLIYV